METGGYEGRQRGEWSRRESLELDPRKYVELLYDQGDILWQKMIWKKTK